MCGSVKLPRGHVVSVIIRGLQLAQEALLWVTHESGLTLFRRGALPGHQAEAVAALWRGSLLPLALELSV